MMKEIEGYNGLYKINESGIVVNSKGHPLRAAMSNTGYLRVALLNPGYTDRNDRTNESIHRLVAKTFIPNPNNLPVVMHKDNDKLNNHVSNLKWGTDKENIQQAIADGLWDNHTHKRPVKYSYEVYNDKTGDSVKCKGREEVAGLIGYSEISLKNMVGNDREISNGDFAGYKIRRGDKVKNLISFK